MRVVLVNRFFYPDESATSQLATDLVVHLIAHGLETVVVCSSATHSGGAKVEPGGLPDGIDVRRLWATKAGRRNLLGRLLDYSTFYVVCGLWLLRYLKRGDLVVCMTDPPMIGAVATLAGRLRGAKVCHWLQDIFPEVAVRLGVMKSRKLVWALTRIRNWSLRRADANVVIGRRMGEKVQVLAGNPPTLLPNWPVEEGETQVDELRTREGFHGKLVVGYSGNLGRAHQLDILVDAAERLRNEPRIQFLLIGDGARKRALVHRVEKARLPNVCFWDFQPRQDLRRALSVPDLHVVSLDPQLEGLIVPSKFVGALAAERPVIFVGAADGEVAEWIQTFGCGLVVPPDGSAELARALELLLNSPQSLSTMKANASTLWRSRFSRARALNAWFEFIRELQPDKDRAAALK